MALSCLIPICSVTRREKCDYDNWANSMSHCHWYSTHWRWRNLDNGKLRIANQHWRPHTRSRVSGRHGIRHVGHRTQQYWHRNTWGDLPYSHCHRHRCWHFGNGFLLLPDRVYGFAQASAQRDAATTSLTARGSVNRPLLIRFITKLKLMFLFGSANETGLPSNAL